MSYPIKMTGPYFKRRRSLAAFTLIELLVVIAIISLLVSILLPSLAKAKELAKEVVCLSNIRGIDMAFNFYIDDYNGWILHSAYWPEFSGSPHNDWPKYYHQYLDLSETGSDGNVLTITEDENIFDCPNIENTPATVYGYALNIDIWPAQAPYGVHSISGEGKPSTLLRMAEPASNWVVGSSLCWNSNLYPARHREGTLYLFCDGHVEWLEANQIHFVWTHGDYCIRNYAGP